MNIILISGKAQSGKDTTASIMKSNLESEHKVIIIHYADLLKYICSTFFNWDGNKDVKGRALLQHVGTDIIRKYNPDYWVEFIVNLLNMFTNEWEYVIIPDVRFPNEIEYFKREGFNVLTIRIERDNFKSNLTEEQLNHISETALDNYKFDKVIKNNGTIDDLKDVICGLRRG